MFSHFSHDDKRFVAVIADDSKLTLAALCAYVPGPYVRLPNGRMFNTDNMATDAVILTVSGHTFGLRRSVKANAKPYIQMWQMLDIEMPSTTSVHSVRCVGAFWCVLTTSGLLMVFDAKTLKHIHTQQLVEAETMSQMANWIAGQNNGMVCISIMDRSNVVIDYATPVAFRPATVKSRPPGNIARRAHTFMKRSAPGIKLRQEAMRQYGQAMLASRKLAQHSPNNI